MESKSATRKGTSPIRVWVTPEEKQEITDNAKAHGMSASSFLRTVGIGIPVVSKIDKMQVSELAKLNADQGRLGGLLKLWLTNDEKLAHFDQNKLIGTIETALETIYANQRVLLEKVSKL